MTSDGYQWRDPSFQAHHQRLAGESLDNYADLVTITLQKENLHGKALVGLGKDDEIYSELSRLQQDGVMYQPINGGIVVIGSLKTWSACLRRYRQLCR